MDVVLVYFKKDGERKDFPLESGKTVLGRKDNCALRVPLEQISREHCEFEVTDDSVVLRDLNSSNGTYVNNKRIAEEQLKPGDQVVVGPVVFIVQIDGEPASPEPVKPHLEAAEKRPTGGDVVDAALADAGDDETSEAALVDDDFELGESDFSPSKGGSSDTKDDESRSDALEALASGEEEEDPFAELEEEEK